MLRDLGGRGHVDPLEDARIEGIEERGCLTVETELGRPLRELFRPRLERAFRVEHFLLRAMPQG